MTQDTVQWARADDIAVITVNNPPVNALSHSVRAGLLKAMRSIEHDPHIHAIVISCAGRTFIAGADISEFALPPREPHLPEVTEAIERCTKPVVVALHGSVLGGGFEIALAAHWRVAVQGTQLGLPEVKLGLMPGAGGTQRLPRLIGADRALKLIPTGDSMTVTQALEWGAVDEVVMSDPVTAAILAAQRLANAPASLRRTGTLSVAPLSAEALTQARSKAAKQRGLIAPGYCITAIETATQVEFQAGLKRERALFLELRASPQAAALRHAFLGEREVAHVADLPRDTPLRTINQAAVIGAGTMGGGIAMCFANAGIPVLLLEAEAAALESGMQRIQQTYAASVTKGSLSAAQREQRLQLITPTLDWQALSTADLILEAVFEEVEVKRQVLKKMDEVAKPTAILATNTSYLDVAQLAAFTSRPQHVVGMHFFSPANVMRLLEVVRTPLTSATVQATAMKLGKTLGKVAVMVGGCDGFVGNRMLAQRTREIYFLLEEGALPEQVDRVMVEFGFAMGPFAVGDLSGLDIGWRNRKSRAHLRKPNVRDCDLLDQVCELGRLGQKTQAGWYRYEPGSRTPIPDPVIEQLIVEHSRRKHIERRAISDQEIIERCVYSMINEGAKILAEGVAARATDIDMVWLHGYGFPAWRGGPMFYAQQVGLEKVLHAIEGYAQRFGPDFWAPAPLLQQLVEQAKGFYPDAHSTPANVC